MMRSWGSQRRPPNLALLRVLGPNMVSCRVYQMVAGGLCLGVLQGALLFGVHIRVPQFLDTPI